MSQAEKNSEHTVLSQNENEETLEAPNENEEEKIKEPSKFGSLSRSKSYETVLKDRPAAEYKEKTSKKPSMFSAFIPWKRKSKSCYDLLANDENQEKECKTKGTKKLAKEKSHWQRKKGRNGNQSEMKVNDESKYHRMSTPGLLPIMPSTSTAEAQMHQANANDYKSNLFENEDEETELMLPPYKYRVGPIGLGAAGTCVYSGVNTKDERKVAIKKINCHTPKQSRQYQREIDHLLHLKDCPNTVKYLDVKREKNVVYIVLELMEGTLETLVNKPDLNINYTQACRDIVSALDFLHNQTKNTIIHRDIKPRNILYVSSPRLLLKLADFGLSKVIESDSSSIGFNGGTRCWMAPEVIRSLNQFSTASDIFAAGLVLHYLMTSRNPFAPTDVKLSKENRLLVESKTINNILVQKLNLNGCLSSETLHLIGRMVNEDETQRLNAKEVLAHPFFWTDKKKVDFLQATANQPEIFQNDKNAFKEELQTKLGAQFQQKPWSEWSPTMAYIFDEMMVAGRRSYNTTSVADLLRFVRNACQHVSQRGRTPIF